MMKILSLKYHCIILNSLEVFKFKGINKINIKQQINYLLNIKWLFKDMEWLELQIILMILKALLMTFVHFHLFKLNHLIF
jgi:hypothetical protein